LDKKGTNIFQIPLQGSVDPETHFFLRDLLSGASWTEHHAEFILTFLVSDLPQEKWGYRSKESMDDEAGRESSHYWCLLHPWALTVCPIPGVYLPLIHTKYFQLCTAH
jgi:hypothetical protein